MAQRVAPNRVFMSGFPRRNAEALVVGYEWNGYVGSVRSYGECRCENSPPILYPVQLPQDRNGRANSLLVWVEK